MVFHIGGQLRQGRRVPQGKPTLRFCHRNGGNSEKNLLGISISWELSSNDFLLSTVLTKGLASKKGLFFWKSSHRRRGCGAARSLILMRTRFTGNKISIGWRPFNMLIPEANSVWQLLMKVKSWRVRAGSSSYLRTGKEWLIWLNCIENLVLWTETENLQYIQTQGVKPCDIVNSATSRYYTQSLLDLIKHCKYVKITAVTNQCLWIEKFCDIP